MTANRRPIVLATVRALLDVFGLEPSTRQQRAATVHDATQLSAIGDLYVAEDGKITITIRTKETR